MTKADQEPNGDLTERATRSWENYISKHGTPEAVVFDITNICNCAECAHCYIRAVKPGAIGANTALLMDFTTAFVWSGVLARRSETKPKQIWVAGGEPTMHEGLGRILSHIKKNDFYTCLVTNGERFSEENYTRWLISLGYLNEIDVSVRGQGPLHDLFMTSADNPLWGLIPTNISFEDQIKFVKEKTTRSTRFDQSIRGLVNLAQFPNITIGLNVDMTAAADMTEFVKTIKERGGHVDTIYIQVQQEAGRELEFPDSIPNQWRRPSRGMVEKYLAQSRELTDSGLVKSISIIDPIPPEIEEALNLKNEPLYQPSATPAISPLGELREDVVFADEL